jgi:acetoin utilization deacetylase AcuC-like enzyme
MTGLLYHTSFLNHDTGPGHPERSERLTATYEYLSDQPWFTRVVPITPRRADPRWVEEVHSRDYLNRAAEACQRHAPYLDVYDVSISPESFEIAMLAVGGILEAADQVIAGNLSNAFALVRPPGHHAERSLALGFCLLNNVAILARYLQKHHGLDKILIVDWDVHHGNGTQHTFEEDPSVLYISLHQYPFYPGSGAASETGKGRGVGATLNCPMPAGAGDAEYETAFREQVLPKASTFRPEAVLISAGFDAHRDDPLAQICLTTACYRWMSERLMEVAQTHASGRIISSLEGGYSLEALPRSVSEHLTVLLAASGSKPAS